MYIYGYIFTTYIYMCVCIYIKLYILGYNLLNAPVHHGKGGTKEMSQVADVRRKFILAHILAPPLSWGGPPQAFQLCCWAGTQEWGTCEVKGRPPN